MITLAIPFIILIIELAVSNAYHGILLASLPGVRGLKLKIHKFHSISLYKRLVSIDPELVFPSYEVNFHYSNYLVVNASATLMGLFLSLLWLVCYRVGGPQRGLGKASKSS